MELTPKQQAALDAFRSHGAMLRTSEAMRLGIHQDTIRELARAEHLVEVSRGVYRLGDAPDLESPDLALVAKRVPAATLCLISALSYHGLTTEIPHEIYIALPRGKTSPRLAYPRLRVFWFSGAALTEGVETHQVDGLPLRVYGPEKTVADCFKFRNKIGLDVALEGLRFYLERRGASRSTLLHYARVCRVERVMLPYLEAMQ